MLEYHVIPVVVIHKNYRWVEYERKVILFPVGSHKEFINIINATVLLAKMLDATVHLYSVHKKGQEWSEGMKSNIELSKKIFEENHIFYKRIIEEQAVYSVGYSKQILLYAEKVKADFIAIMSNQSDEYYYIADNDKEMLLTNEQGIPVLCANEKTRELS